MRATISVQPRLNLLSAEEKPLNYKEKAFTRLLASKEKLMTFKNEFSLLNL